MEASDEALMSRVRGGDAEAFGAIYARYGKRIFNFLRHLGLPPAAAEDGLQEVFLRIWRARDRYRPEAPFRPYLYRSARNHWADAMRRGKLDMRRYLAARGSAEPAPAARAERREAERRLRASIAALPDGIRLPFVLRRLHGLSYKEVAEIAGLDARQVEYRVQEGFERLAEAIDQEPRG